MDDAPDTPATVLRGNVTALFGGTPPGEPSEAIVAELESLLAAARRGEVRGLAFAAAGPNGAASFGHYAEDDATFVMAGAVMALHHDLGAHLAGDED